MSLSPLPAILPALLNLTAPAAALHDDTVVSRAAAFEENEPRFHEWNHVDSIEGLDRHQDACDSPTGVSHAAITDDSTSRTIVSLSDTRDDVRVGVTVTTSL